MKKRKIKVTNGKLILCSIIFAIVIFILCGILCKKLDYKVNENDNLIGQNSNENNAKYKVNNSYDETALVSVYEKELNDQYVGSFNFSNIKIEENENNTIFTADVENKASNKYVETPFYIYLYDQNNNCIQTIEGIIPEIEYGESKPVEVWLNDTFYDAIDLQILLDN